MPSCFKNLIDKCHFKIKVQDFPEDVAYPLGGSSNEFKYFILQIHYNNPNKLEGNF